ncbi:MAG: UDP-glucose/GDP-mannose dehydrogenase family protein [Promethearchaeia archaeon]
MNAITIVGTGYVGLGYAAGFTKKGLKVFCIDLDETIVETINKGKSPIDEPGMDDAIRSAVDKDLLTASTDIMEGWADTKSIFICVGTYCDEEGNIDLSQVRSAAHSIGKALREDREYRAVCVKSTVIPGTTDGVVAPILEQESGKKVGADFGLCMSPEFLREGNALEDILNPDKIVVGGVDQKSINTIEKNYRDFEITRGHPIIETDLRTAELIKYAQNSFLAMKVSFINEMANLAEEFGVNVGDVAKALGVDKRISSMYLRAGPGFGGSCFPKDVLALLSAAKKVDYNAQMLKATLNVNDRQKRHGLELVESISSLEGKTVALLGLAFKPNTGDTRESVSITVINDLLRKETKKISVYDPSEFAREEIYELIGDKITYATSAKQCLAKADIALILTGWQEFKELEPSFFVEHMAENPILVDTRRIYDETEFQKAGVTIKVLGQSNRKDFVPS